VTVDGRAGHPKRLADLLDGVVAGVAGESRERDLVFDMQSGSSPLSVG
jgi:hypothetical protein